MEPKTAVTADHINALAPQVRGCVGPDGHAWFCIKAGDQDQIVRYVDGRFEAVASSPIYVESMVSFGDALFVVTAYDPGAVLRDGAWTRFPLPAFSGGTLVGDGRHAPWFVSQDGTVFRWKGSEFEAVKAPKRPDAVRLVDVDGALLLVEEGVIRRVDDKGVTKLPKAPVDVLFSACRSGNSLVLLDMSTRVLVLPLGERKAQWRGPFELGCTAQSLLPLATGQVLAYSLDWPIVTFDPATGLVTPAGTRILRQGGGTTAVVPTHDGALFVGGTLLGVIDGSNDPLMQPQLWRDGKVTAAIAGFEQELAAQAEDQLARSFIFRSQRGPSFEESMRALAAKPPKSTGEGATPADFAELESLTKIPRKLRELWAWANGCKGLFLRSEDSEECTDSLYSVREAAVVLQMNRDAGMDEDFVPFGGEPGSGDCLVLDAITGRVLYWNHEENDTSDIDSLDALLARTVKAHNG